MCGGAEQKLATHLWQKGVANPPLDCGEPYLSNKPNTSHSTCGETNFSCGDMWRGTKHPQVFFNEQRQADLLADEAVRAEALD